MPIHGPGQRIGGGGEGGGAGVDQVARNAIAALAFHAVTHQGTTTFTPVAAEADVAQANLWYVVAAAGLSGALAGHANELVRKTAGGAFQFKDAAAETVYHVLGDTVDSDGDHEGFVARIVLRDGAWRRLVEGRNNTASGALAHVEGGGVTASGEASHAEGADTIASGEAAHAEGNTSQATGRHSHAEGHNSRATALAAHAEGEDTHATAQASHAQGLETTANKESTAVVGKRGVVGHPDTLFGFAHGAGPPTGDQRTGDVDVGLVAKVKRDGTIVAPGFRVAADPAAGDGQDLNTPAVLSQLPMLDLALAPSSAPNDAAWLRAGETVPTDGHLPLRLDLGTESTPEAGDYFGLSANRLTFYARRAGRALIHGHIALTGLNNAVQRGLLDVIVRRTSNAVSTDYHVAAPYVRSGMNSANGARRAEAHFSVEVPVPANATVAVMVDMDHDGNVSAELESGRFTATWMGAVKGDRGEPPILYDGLRVFDSLLRTYTPAGGLHGDGLWTRTSDTVLTLGEDADNLTRATLLAAFPAGTPADAWLNGEVVRVVAAAAGADALTLTAQGGATFPALAGNVMLRVPSTLLSLAHADRRYTRTAQGGAGSAGTGGDPDPAAARLVEQTLVAYGWFPNAELVGGEPVDAPFQFLDIVGTTLMAGTRWELDPSVPVAGAGAGSMWRTEAFANYATGTWVNGAQHKARVPTGATLYATSEAGAGANEVPPAGWTHFGTRGPTGDVTWIARNQPPQARTLIWNLTDHFRYAANRRWAVTPFNLATFRRIAFVATFFTTNYLETRRLTALLPAEEILSWGDDLTESVQSTDNRWSYRAFFGSPNTNGQPRVAHVERALDTIGYVYASWSGGIHCTFRFEHDPADTSRRTIRAVGIRAGGLGIGGNLKIYGLP